jgi:hypothetical protein
VRDEKRRDGREGGYMRSRIETIRARREGVGRVGEDSQRGGGVARSQPNLASARQGLLLVSPE